MLEWCIEMVHSCSPPALQFIIHIVAEGVT